MKRKYVILLTACVNPSGMPFTVLTDTSERLRQYRDALDFYLNETPFPIVFCENTLCDFSSDYKSFIDNGRLEYLTFDGNRFDKSKGKGYGEANIMEEAFRRSRLLATCDMLVKITGRLIVRNIALLLKDNDRMLTTTIQTFFPNHRMIDSRVLVIPKEYAMNDFLTRKERINDSEGVFFEHVLYESLLSRHSYVYIPFLKVPLIEGMSGSKGDEYKSGQAHFDNTRFAFDMLGNALRMDKSMRSYRMPFILRMLIFFSRCVLCILTNFLYALRPFGR